MEGKRFIQTLRLTNLLSYGSEGEEIELQPLNVLIGANASGKSNLIEAIGLLRATPKDLAGSIRRGGGIREWLWKGSADVPIAAIEASVSYRDENTPLQYQLLFTTVGQKLEIVDEIIAKNLELKDQVKHNRILYQYRGRGSRGEPYLTFHDYESDLDVYRSYSDDKIAKFDEISNSLVDDYGDVLMRDESILSQVKDPRALPELTYLGNQFDKIRVYRTLDVGYRSKLRQPQQADQPNNFLEEDASNFSLILNNLQNQLKTKRLIIENLQKFYSSAVSIAINIEGGTVQTFIEEEELGHLIPATRLSDGTLRFLCLLTLLCHPNPPPLICIEEPEIGLHPDILPTIAELLIEASQRTQLIVTTHSDVLVSALSPEAVLVCERDDRGTHLQRLDSAKLAKWIEHYSLGELWRMGEIGGNRW